MEKLIEELLRALIAFLSLPNITTTDKILVVITSLVAVPYLLYVTTKIYKFSKDLPAILPKWYDEKKEKLKTNFPMNILRNKLINSALEKMVYDAGADKAYLFQFHNGGENIRGIPFIKLSMTNEWCPISVKREASNFKDLPVGIFSGLSYCLIQKKKLYFSDVEDIKKQDTGTYALFKSKDVESVYISGLFDLQDSLVGLVVLEFYEKTVLEEDDLFIFEKTVGIVAGLVLCKDGDDPHTCSMIP